MNGSESNEEETATQTPVSEYVLLAASPRPVPAAPSQDDAPVAFLDASSSSSSNSSSVFTLKSPFTKKRNQQQRNLSDEVQDGDEEEKDDLELLNDVVDAMVVLESPRQSSKKTQRQLDQIREALASHENDDDADDGKEEGDGDNGDEEEEEEEVYRYVYLNSPEENAALGYCNNTVVTSRFTIYNFIPKLLFYEFSKLANAYFLVISVMQTIKPISNTGGFPASLPALTIIVLIDMFFACLEDYKRHKADNIANELPCLKYSLETRTFEASKWYSLHVGDVVKLYNREAVPADLVILAACEPDPENPAGICYVETKSLDGETNLKLRQGLEATYTNLLSDDQVGDLAGVVVCEAPNNSIHRFNGSLSLKGGKKEAITTNAVVLRGSTLRNTEYIYGLVVNTGPDTKIMMASSSTPMKWSNMERRLNRQILYICALMIVLCLTGAIASSVWNHANLSDVPGEQAWYLFDSQATAVKAPVGNFVIQVLYYFLLLNSFIPVSLYVSMTSVKFMQAYFMNNDLEMYHEESDTPFQVRTMSLNEELGQIDYIFSDKTGTLTCNIMEFRKCSINGVAYGMGETEVGIAAKKRRQAEESVVGIPEKRAEEEVDDDSRHRHREITAPFVNYHDDAIFDALAREGSEQAEVIHQFFEHLGVCHTVMPEKAPDGSLRLSASSPDEQALVAAAGCFGYKFVARSPGKAMVEYFSCVENTGNDASMGQPVQGNQVGAYQVLEVLEFNSTRKRMSVIIRAPDGKLKLLCKGADTVMYERLRPTTDQRVLQVRNKTLQDMEMFASEGLRTLVIGEAEVDENFFESWVIRYRTAINDMRQIELRRVGEKNDIDRLMEEVEVNLEVLGATAIEDRLQAEVPDTIHKLRQASIKIWMLTGDKEETAINIGFACRLLTSDVERVVISADTHPDLGAIVEELEQYSTLRNNDGDSDFSSSGTKREGQRHRDTTGTPTTSTESEENRPLTRIESVACINATQEELALVIDGETLELALEECPELLLSVAEKCVAVIACRVSPAQKAQLVHLVRDNNPAVRTLAIGDGANDVSMIQAAHVGVGISGQEGMQAANSSDYAIAQFRFLSRLLLVHGRWNYVRMGKLILYIFYKNVMMNLTQFWYMIFTGFSGQKFFLEWGLQGYNLLFTALPIVLVSTFEQDVPAYLAHNYPLLYRIGQENSHFNTKIVWAWISSCVWESLIISFGTLYGMRYLIESGETPTMWVYGCTAFTIVLLVVTLKLCLHQQMWWPIHVVIYVCSVSLWVITAAVISGGKSVSSAYWNGVFSGSFGVQVFWLLVPLLTFSALSRDFLWKGYTRAFHPSYKHLAQEVSAFGLVHLADKLLAFPPAEKIPWGDVEAHDGQEPLQRASSRSRVSTSEALKMAVSAVGAGSAITMSMPVVYRQPTRKSVSRGSAFSYDAESVMVESFMATDRYNNQDPHEARTLFDRHASRGSMAFHSLPNSKAVAHALGALNDEGGSAPPAPRGRERLHSAGSIFRGARHSFARRRFASISTTNAMHNSSNGSSSGSSFVAGNRNSMHTPGSGSRAASNSEEQSPHPRSYHHTSSGGDDGAPTPHSGEAEQQHPVPLVRRYTTPKLNRQMSA